MNTQFKKKMNFRKKKLMNTIVICDLITTLDADDDTTKYKKLEEERKSLINKGENLLGINPRIMYLFDFKREKNRPFYMTDKMVLFKTNDQEWFWVNRYGIFLESSKRRISLKPSQWTIETRDNDREINTLGNPRAFYHHRDDGDKSLLRGHGIQHGANQTMEV